MKTWPKTLERLTAAVWDWCHRNWQKALRIREKIHFREEVIHLALAGAVGVIGGLVNLAFSLCIKLVQMLTLGHVGDVVEVAQQLDWWHRLIVPTAGGLVAGAVLYWGLRVAGQQGASNLLEVVVAGDGRLPFRTALVKSLSSLVSIGSGASIGREGSITQFTATLASKAGQLARWQPYRLRLLLACGAAAGIAAAYNAPIAGAVFAAQIVLGNFSMSLFAPLVFASVVSSMVSRSFFGLTPLYHAPPFDFTSLAQLPWFVLLGALAGGLGALFLKMLRTGEFYFNRLRAPPFVRLALGGLVVGAIGLEYAEVWGNGYTAANRVLTEQLPLLWLLGLVLAKLLATVATVGSGTVGGVFTPTLFLGAGLGSLFAATLSQLGCGTTLPSAAFALVGMASLLAATTHSPLLAMIMVFEISLNYSLMPALMLACAVATLVSRSLHPNTIYTEPLRLKGLPAGGESAELGAATRQTVAELMRQPVPPVRDTTPFPEIAERFLTSPNNFLPVVDAQQRLLGMVSLHDLKEYLNAGQELRGVIAYDVMRPVPACLTPNQRLLDVLPVLLATEIRNIPVVNTLTENRLVGALVRADALGLLSEAIAATGGEKD